MVVVLAAGVLLARPQAQGRPPIAIAGARIIDGSGNEPFVGTIVFAGGRITAVGRQVAVPADAQTIDGTGKTVLPGIIETELRASLVDTSDAGRRRLGVALAGGRDDGARCRRARRCRQDRRPRGQRRGSCRRSRRKGRDARRRCRRPSASAATARWRCRWPAIRAPTRPTPAR